MIPYPLHAMAVLFTGEDIETNFGPVVDSLRDFESFMLLMIGRIDAVEKALLSIGCEVGVQLDHGAAWGFSVCAVDLDLVVSLRACIACEKEESGCREIEDSR